jgi:hypothetical protein
MKSLIEVLETQKQLSEGEQEQLKRDYMRLRVEKEDQRKDYS